MIRSTRDLRKYARSTQVRIVVGALALLFGVGGLLIYTFYGPGGATLGLVCLVVGLAPVILIALALWMFERVAQRGREGSVGEVGSEPPWRESRTRGPRN